MINICSIGRGRLPTKKYGFDHPRGEKTTLHPVIKGMMYDILIGLKENGCEIWHITKGLPSQPKVENLNGIFIYRIPLTERFLDHIYGFRTIPIVSKIFSNVDIDIMHIWGIPYWHTWGGFISKILRRPVVFTVDDLWHDLALGVGDLKVRSIKARIYEFLEKEIPHIADKIITVSDGLKNALLNFGISEQKISVIPNGVNTDLFNPNVNAQNIRKKFNFGKDDIVIGFVGFLSHWQGVGTIIKAIIKAKKAIPNVKLLLVGEGPLYDSVKGLTKKYNFIFAPGRIPHDKVSAYISAMDLTVVSFPNLPGIAKEVSPLKLYEYMACGKPIISTRVGDIPKILDKSHAGIIVSPENSGQMAKAIVFLGEHEDLRRQMGLNARQYVERYHSWTVLTKKMIKIYEEIV